MISTGEARAQRRITAAYIAADPVEVAIVRPVWTSDGASGRTEGTPKTLLPQRFKLIRQQDSGLFRTTADGKQVSPDHRLLGTFDADLERYDRFTLDGKRFEVVYVSRTDYEVKGEVIYLG